MASVGDKGSESAVCGEKIFLPQTNKAFLDVFLLINPLPWTVLNIYACREQQSVLGRDCRFHFVHFTNCCCGRNP